MPEYHTLRFLLGLLCTCAAIQLPRDSSIRWYFIVSSIELIFPIAAYDNAYKVRIWLPLEALRVSFAWMSSAELFRATTRRRLYRNEQRLLVIFSLLIGGAFVWFGWHWVPRSAIQTFGTIRQYSTLTLAVGWSAVYWHLYVRRPVGIGRLALTWVCWLWFGLIGSITGVGGLAWIVLPWKMMPYRVLSDISLSGQFIILLWAVLEFGSALQARD